MKIFQNISLKPFNTFGVDAKASILTRISNEKELEKLISKDFFTENKRVILGGGSNILFSRDFDGIVINVDIKGMRMVEITGDYVIIECGAGENWHEFAKTMVKNKYYGIENLALIPGNVGSAPVQNIGAYGVEQKDFFHSLRGFDLEQNKFREMTPEQCNLGYRSSVFKTELKNKFIITSVKYKLNKKPVMNLSYAGLKQEMDKFIVVEPTPEYLFYTVCRIRRSKLPDPSLLGNAGSFFKNPMVPAEMFKSLSEKFAGIKYWEAGPDKYKIPAAWLIEQCGWKGKRFGNAGVSEKHALILINYGDASGKEILELSENIKNSVIEKFGIELEREVNVI